MQLQQAEKPLKQQLRSILWQNGGIHNDLPLENLPEILNDPQALFWLDIQGDCTPSEQVLKDVHSTFVVCT